MVLDAFEVDRAAGLTGRAFKGSRRGSIETAATVIKCFGQAKVLQLNAAMAVFVPVSGVAAVNSEPQPVPYDDPISAARDVPYPGKLRVAVDATALIPAAALEH